MDREKLQEALLHRRQKESRKYLLKTAEELQEQDREAYHAILKCRNWTGEELQKASRRYRWAAAGNTAAAVLALLLIVASYILGDFGLGILTGWLNRYMLAFAILTGIGLLALTTWISTRQKAILIALALCEEE